MRLSGGKGRISWCRRQTYMQDIVMGCLLAVLKANDSVQESDLTEELEDG